VAWHVNKKMHVDLFQTPKRLPFSRIDVVPLQIKLLVIVYETNLIWDASGVLKFLLEAV